MALKWKIYWLVFVITLVVYAVMILWSLPFISSEAKGLIPFDLRPGGYSLEDAQAFLAALSPEGSAFYLDTQHQLDRIYPALLAAVLAFGAIGLAAGKSRVIVGVVILASLVGAVSDYRENTLIAGILSNGAGNLTEQAVVSASMATETKSAATTVAMILVLFLGARRLFLRFRKKASP